MLILFWLGVGAGARVGYLAFYRRHRRWARFLGFCKTDFCYQGAVLRGSSNPYQRSGGGRVVLRRQLGVPPAEVCAPVASCAVLCTGRGARGLLFSSRCRLALCRIVQSARFAQWVFAGLGGVQHARQPQGRGFWIVQLCARNEPGAAAERTSRFPSV